MFLHAAVMPSRRRKSPWPTGPKVGLPAACGEGREIDMGAEVGLAGPIEHDRAAMAAHRLQRGAVRRDAS